MAKNRYEYFGDTVYTVNTAMSGAATLKIGAYRFCRYCN